MFVCFIKLSRSGTEKIFPPTLNWTNWTIFFLLWPGNWRGTANVALLMLTVKRGQKKITICDCCERIQSQKRKTENCSRSPHHIIYLLPRGLFIQFFSYLFRPKMMEEKTTPTNRTGRTDFSAIVVYNGSKFETLPAIISYFYYRYNFFFQTIHLGTLYFSFGFSVLIKQKKGQQSSPLRCAAAP